MIADPNSLIQLGGQVVIVFLFLGYLQKRNGKTDKYAEKVADTLLKASLAASANQKSNEELVKLIHEHVVTSKKSSQAILESQKKLIEADRESRTRR